MNTQNVAIIGGGPVGSCMALILADKGFNITLYDKREDPVIGNLKEEGRSINYILSYRGVKCYEELGIMNELKARSKKFMGNVFHETNGTQHDFPFIDGEDRGWFVKRKDVQQILSTEMKKRPNIKLKYNTSIEKVDIENTTLKEKQQTQNEKVEEMKFDYIFGADGVHSVVRKEFEKLPEFKLEKLDYHDAYQELVVLPNTDGTPQLKEERGHIWMSSAAQVVMVGMQNNDNSFSGPLVLPRQGKFSFEAFKDPGEFEKHIFNHFADAKKYMNNLKQIRTAKPLGNFNIQRCYPWLHKNTLLIGDSVKSASPSSASGLNVFLDSLCLYKQLLGQFNGDIVKTGQEYQTQFHKDSDAIFDFTHQLHQMQIRSDVNQELLGILYLCQYLETTYRGLYLSQQTLSQRTLLPFRQVYSFGQVERAMIGEIFQNVGGLQSVQELVVKKQWDQRIDNVLRKYQNVYDISEMQKGNQKDLNGKRVNNNNGQRQFSTLLMANHRKLYNTFNKSERQANYCMKLNKVLPTLFRYFK